MYFNIKCIGKLPGPTNEFERPLVFDTSEFERPKFDCIRRINRVSEGFKARKIVIFHHFTFYEHLKFHAQLS